MKKFFVMMLISAVMFITQSTFAAENIKVGDILMDKEGKYHTITNISRKNIVEDIYNLDVEDNHNYYVTKNNILVHNAKNMPDATMRG